MWSTWGCTINFAHQKLTLTFIEHDAPVYNWSSGTSKIYKVQRAWCTSFIIRSKNCETIKHTKNLNISSNIQIMMHTFFLSWKYMHTEVKSCTYSLSCTLKSNLFVHIKDYRKLFADGCFFHKPQYRLTKSTRMHVFFCKRNIHWILRCTILTNNKKNESNSNNKHQMVSRCKNQLDS